MRMIVAEKPDAREAPVRPASPGAKGTMIFTGPSSMKKIVKTNGNVISLPTLRGRT